MVSPLFEHVAHKDYLDSFFVIGLNFWAISSMLFEHQIAFAIALIKREAKGFTKDDVKKWENKRIKDLQENEHSLKHFHYFEHPNTYNQWGYFEQLSKYTNSPSWIPNVFIKIAMHFFGEWKTQHVNIEKLITKF
uniref:Uncharacterized protein n=1 Tax=Acrobeloides nanus TaxID=290746 RepID=A0A914ECI1_9BILA